MIKNYIDAINNNISQEHSKKIEFFPKTLISLAGVQMILYIFSTTCAAHII